jgi:hypothetical protein
VQHTRFVVPTLSGLGLALLLTACSGSSGGITPSGVAPGSQTLTHNALVLEQTYKPISVIGHPDWILRTGYVSDPNGYSRPNPDGRCTGPLLGVPNWMGSFKDGSTQYCYQMVGVRPTRTARSITLTTQVYAYKLTFSNGDVFDPTAIDPNCDSVSPYTRMMDSPLYHAAPIVNGNVKLGRIQYEDAQSVGEWYKFVKTDKRYGIKLRDTGKPVVISLTVPASEGHTVSISGSCNGVFGVVDFSWLASQISMTQWSTKQVPVVLLWDVAQMGSGTTCCIVGYHDYYFKNGQNGVYSVISLISAGISKVQAVQDITFAAHEFGELINDPFGKNMVPPWGHVGQQPNCQNNLEVGDPLSGTVYDGGAGITLNGFTYHPQELVYFNWFTQQTKYAKYGADDVYSMSGTFKTPATLCT